MPVRLKMPYEGQAANTTYWATPTIEGNLIATGIADSLIERASDYEQQGQTISAATSAVSANATDYIMNSSSAQVLTLGLMGNLPIGQVLTISQMGTGTTTLTPAAGVTVNTKLTSLVTAGQYSIGQLKKVGPGLWLAFGGFGG
jgi:hypothetical protein